MQNKCGNHEECDESPDEREKKKREKKSNNNAENVDVIKRREKAGRRERERERERNESSYRRVPLRPRQVKELFFVLFFLKVLPNQHTCKLVSAFLAFVCKACTKIVVHVQKERKKQKHVHLPTEKDLTTDGEETRTYGKTIS